MWAHVRRARTHRYRRTARTRGGTPLGVRPRGRGFPLFERGDQVEFLPAQGLGLPHVPGGDEVDGGRHRMEPAAFDGLAPQEMDGLGEEGELLRPATIDN